MLSSEVCLLAASSRQHVRRRYSFLRVQRSVFLAFLTTLISLPVAAVDEARLVDLEPEIMAAYEAGFASTYQSPDGISIAYSYFDSAKASSCLLVLTGRTEMRRKYAEFIYDLQQRDYCVFIKDWRGQGSSERLLSDSQKGHVTDYRLYKDDLHEFVETIIRPELKGRRLLALAHSMGANVLSLYAAEHPDAFAKIVFSAPMLDIPTAGIPQRILWMALRAMEFLGFGGAYVPTHGPYDPNEANYVSSSETRRQLELDLKQRYAQELVAGATVSWARASLEATWAMKQVADQITTPVLMLQAGKDEIVLSEGQDIVCSRAQNCRKEFFAQAKHEILMETDPIRNRALKLIFAFFEGDAG